MEIKAITRTRRKSQFGTQRSIQKDGRVKKKKQQPFDRISGWKSNHHTTSGNTPTTSAKNPQTYIS
jgi:hypothetical protein